MTAKRFLAAALCVVAFGCKSERVEQTAEGVDTAAGKVKDKVRDALGIGVPVGAESDRAQRERERFDAQWRQLESFRERMAQMQRSQGPTAPQPPATFRFVTGVKESFKGATAATINSAPLNVPIDGDRAGPSVLKAQVWLDRISFSVGVIDGRWGRNSAIAVWWYQRARGIEATGAVDEATFRALAREAGYADAVVSYAITDEDVKGPFVDVPEDMYDKAKLDCLCYESAVEKIAEKFHVDVEFLEALNPDVDLPALRAGQTIVVPNVRPPLQTPRRDFARVVVSIAGNTFNGYDAAGNLVFHAPTTLGSKYDPSPRETLTVKKIVEDPHFHYQPKLFAEVPDYEPEANLQPGPNSPVGVVWIALSKPHYGIHGTSDPDVIGYASSHGCVRLTNWDAREVALRIREGGEVAFVDTRQKGSTASSS